MGTINKIITKPTKRGKKSERRLLEVTNAEKADNF